mgnify:FL=1
MIILSAAILISIVCLACYKWECGKSKIHIHSFYKPIASMYVSFHCRDIVYQCRCGEMVIKRECRAFSDPFPIQTNISITRKELEQIANENI